MDSTLQPRNQPLPQASLRSASQQPDAKKEESGAERSAEERDGRGGAGDELGAGEDDRAADDGVDQRFSDQVGQG